MTWLGGRVADSFGYDLRGTFIGSEGTLGIATKIIVRLVPAPASIITLLAVFDTVQQASETVSTIISAGMIPAAMEMMDRLTLQAAEAGLQCGYPPDAGAVLLVELDGLPEVVDSQAVRVRANAWSGRGRSPPRDTQRERELLWKGRKGAIPALGRLHRTTKSYALCRVRSWST